MTRWEYKAINPGLRASLDETRLAKKLNEEGDDGWELVGFKGDLYIFKRQRP